MKKLFLSGAALILFYSLLFFYLYFFEAQKYTGYERCANQQADALVVFFGDFDASGNINSESQRRLSFAVDLYKKNVGKNIIFVGGWRPSKTISGSALMAQNAVKMGVDPANVFYDRTSRDTVQNWQEAEKIIEAKKFKKVLLISSFFHIIRIEKMIEIRNGIDAFFTGYSENSIIPVKSLRESFSDYNYNVISFLTYRVLPSGFYQIAVSRIRD